MNRSEKLPRFFDYKYEDKLVKIRSWITQLEEDTLRDLAKDKIYLEIGTQNGGSLFAVHKVAKKIICVDPFNGDGNYRNIYYPFAHKNDKITLIREYSQNILDYLQTNKFDMIFIDGDHSYDAVRQDLFNSADLIKDNGTIVCHDYDIEAFPGVKKAVDDYLSQTDRKYNYRVIDSMMIMEAL